MITVIAMEGGRGEIIFLEWNTKGATIVAISTVVVVAVKEGSMNIAPDGVRIIVYCRALELFSGIMMGWAWTEEG